MAKGLRLVTSKPAKPKRTYAGKPLECPKCGARHGWKKTHSVEFKNGKHTWSRRPTGAECRCGHWVETY